MEEASGSLRDEEAVGTPVMMSSLRMELENDNSNEGREEEDDNAGVGMPLSTKSNVENENNGEEAGEMEEGEEEEEEESEEMDEEFQEDYDEGEDGDEEEEEEDEEGDEEEGNADEDGGVTNANNEEKKKRKKAKKKENACETFKIGNKKYLRTAFIQNEGLTIADKKLHGNPKAEFQCCMTTKPHNILQCKGLHLAGRAMLLGGNFYIRLNMMEENKGKRELLSNPSKALNKSVCFEPGEHAMQECEKIHLRPQVVFIGTEALRTAYYVEELLNSLGLKHLQDVKLADQCGSWCKTSRSHVVTTCRYIHYSRGKQTYTEKAKAPSIPLAAIPDMTPKKPRVDGGRGGRGGRGRGGRGGRGGGRGGRGGGRGGRGGRRGGRGVPIPDSLRPPASGGGGKTAAAAGTPGAPKTEQHAANTLSSTKPTRSDATRLGGAQGETRGKGVGAGGSRGGVVPAAAAGTKSMQKDEEDSYLRRMVFVLVGVLVVLLGIAGVRSLTSVIQLDGLKRA